MKSLMQSIVARALAGLLAGGIIVSVYFTLAQAQGIYSPYLYGNYPFSGLFLPYYSSWAGFTGLNFANPFLGGYYGNGSLFSPLSAYAPSYSALNSYTFYNPIMQLNEMYNYLNYALHFYELASQTPFLYIYDQTADYIGANLYNYAANIGVSPQESIIYFIMDNFLSPQQ
ncbi:MAG: hypothetical protein AB1847_07065 [bacterium]